ncbi:MAG: sigma-70 family RNA polymerase sigma factor [Candidatus Omnitrophica bacterium]|nr:hypothetical protein [bacterium]NUN96412.1 sigma-70 family RNA polymerase sigma factor [Candidatus Omnitrophota bacterium]
MPELPSNPPPSDEWLREQLLQSPEEGWSQFWRVHGPFVERIVGRFQLRKEDREEVLQEVSHALVKENFKVLREWNPERCSLRGFLSVIVARNVISFFRSGFHSYNARKSSLPSEGVSPEGFSLLLEDSANTPAERLHRIELVRSLLKLLDDWVAQHQISATDRMLVLLRLRGMTFTQISNALGISRSSATVRFTRIKPFLKRRFEEEGFSPQD